MASRQIVIPEFEVLEPAEMEFFSGQSPLPEKDSGDPRQSAAEGGDQNALAANKRPQEGVGSLERLKAACPDLCWSPDSRFCPLPPLLLGPVN